MLRATKLFALEFGHSPSPVYTCLSYYRKTIRARAPAVNCPRERYTVSREISPCARARVSCESSRNTGWLMVPLFVEHGLGNCAKCPGNDVEANEDTARRSARVYGARYADASRRMWRLSSRRLSTRRRNASVSIRRSSLTTGRLSI